MHSSVVDELIAVFRDELHVEVPSPDTDLFDSGLLDSLQLVQLLLHLEQRPDLRIPLEEVDLYDLRSVHRLARVIAVRAALDRGGTPAVPRAEA